jgi:hypothetical protein
MVYEKRIVELCMQGVLGRDDVVTISVDRAEGLAYRQALTVNALPTLTTNSGALMVLSVGDVVENTPDEKREFIRHVRNTEKLLAQGFPKETHLFLDSRLTQKAAGNAYPVTLMISILHPIVDQLSRFDLA